MVGIHIKSGKEYSRRVRLFPGRFLEKVPGKFPEAGIIIYRDAIHRNVDMKDCNYLEAEFQGYNKWSVKK
jgi:hypothetical protein